EEQRRRQPAGQDEGGVGGRARGSAVDDVREELRRDAAALDAEYGEAVGEFPTPAGQAPEISSVEEATAPPQR
ncbi:MAG: hypothetical protein M3Q48_06155, partial [Actinomycetota bacterium]|nr:hypothetical protein [Actinomycetota bacterium]